MVNLSERSALEQFGGSDYLHTQSAAERLVLKPSKSLLHMVCATAPIGSHTNHWKNIPFCLGSLPLKYAKLLTYHGRTIDILTSYADKL